ncbi:cation:proton antiporter [Lysinimonas soli]|uniref:Cation:proton antiporter n=1 Tax=Lysinimonas soli TaxID=1074233 RepID=A0ABW0NPY7_9MICO
MSELDGFTLALGLGALALIAAVLSNQLSSWIRIPAPALFLVAAAALATAFPALGGVPRLLDEEVVSVALVFILFDGGMHIGWRRFRASALPITWLGIAGTAVTAVGIAAVAHFLLGFDWRLAFLLGAALSPTDPAVVFSVLGKREIAGRSGTILEGESGANDPVGIALMVSLLAATGTGLDAVAGGVAEFALQMLVGAVVGVGGGWLLARLMRRISLSNEALHSIWTLACVLLLYALATLLHGSGFLAVFLAGILSGDSRAPFKREIERFSAGIASLGEIVVFTLLGLSISVSDVLRADVLVPGLVIAALLIFVIRPVLVGLISWPLRLSRGERGFLLWAGLKGAVPILLGIFILEADVPQAQRMYGIIFVVVLVSVVLQGGLVPLFARLFGVPMRIIEPEPWAVGVRLNEEPQGFHRIVLQPDSPVIGRRVGELDLGDDAWVSFVRRDGRLVTLRPSTKLRVGDEVLALAESERRLNELFDPR